MLSGITASPLLSLLYWFPDETVLRAALSTGHLAYNASPPSILNLAVEHLIVITYPFWSADNLTTSCLIPGIIMSMWFFAGLSALVPLIGLELHCSYLTNIVYNLFRIPIIFLVLACYTKVYFLVRGEAARRTRSNRKCLKF